MSAILRSLLAEGLPLEVIQRLGDYLENDSLADVRANAAGTGEPETAEEKIRQLSAGYSPSAMTSLLKLDR